MTTTLPIEYRDVSYCESYGSRRVRQVEASLGLIRRTAPTKSEAKAHLLDAIVAQADNVFSRRYLTDGSVTFALHYCDGWRYDIVRDGRTGCTTTLDEIGEQAAFERMRSHFEAYVGAAA